MPINVSFKSKKKGLCGETEINIYIFTTNINTITNLLTLWTKKETFSLKVSALFKNKRKTNVAVFFIYTHF